LQSFANCLLQNVKPENINKLKTATQYCLSLRDCQFKLNTKFQILRMHFTCYKYLSLRYTILISTSQTDIFNIILNINKNMSTCWNYSTRTSQHIKLQNILRISAFLIPNMLYYGHSILIGLLHVLFPISTAYI